MRKYPGIPILNRECTKDYKVPESDITIKKGTCVIISMFGLGRDPRCFPNPMAYIPERHLDKTQIDENAVIPFGDGPRSCFGKYYE